MSRKRKNITLPAELILDARLLPNAKMVYAVLLTFPKDKPRGGSSAVRSASSVTAMHREIIEASGLSVHTVIKSLNRLDACGWLRRERNAGFPNRYFFRTPLDFDPHAG